MGTKVEMKSSFNIARITQCAYPSNVEGTTMGIGLEPSQTTDGMLSLFALSLRLYPTWTAPSVSLLLSLSIKCTVQGE